MIIPNWHPIFVHFSIALLATAVLLFGLGAAVAKRPMGASLTRAARWDLAIGVVVTLVTLGTGWQAYQTVVHDAPAHVNMTIHMRWAFAAAGLFALAAVAAWLDRGRVAGAGAALLVILVGGLTALTVTGWYGAENVYRYGLGVERLPNPGSHHHHNGDADDDDHASAHPAADAHDARDHSDSNAAESLAPGKAH